MAHDNHDEHEGSGGGHSGGGHSHSHGGSHGGGHEEAHEGAPEWLISFADNVALMMGFFVIMLAMYMKPVVEAAAAASSEGAGSEKGQMAQQVSNDMLDLAIELRQAFNNPVSEGNPNDALL